MEYLNAKSLQMMQEIKNMEKDMSRPAKRKRIVLSLEVNLLII